MSSASSSKSLHLRVGKDGLFDDAFLVEHFGGLLEAFVFHEFLDEFSAGIIGGVELFEFRIAGEESLGLDENEGGGDVDEFGAEIDVRFGGALHVVEVLLRDPGDRNMSWMLIDCFRMRSRRRSRGPS